MKQISEKYPSAIEFTKNGETVFNYNIEEKNGLYEYESVLCVGEPTRYNILQSLIRTIYTQNEIDEIEKIKPSSTNADDILMCAEYNNAINTFDNLISNELGLDFYEFKQNNNETYDYVENNTYEKKLELAKINKISEIERYDVSDNVNGFFCNGQFMWLDRVTRAVLANTINSAELLGESTINIWYNDVVCINVGCDDAKQLLAAIEMYATSCYNITVSHKVAIRNMDSIEDINAFDITADYPNRLEFNI